MFSRLIVLADKGTEYSLLLPERLFCDSQNLGINHRIMNWFGWEEISKGHLVQPPYRQQGHLQLEQGAQSPKQSDLNRASTTFGGLLGSHYP